MKKLVLACLLLGSALGGCSYGGVAVTPDGHAVIVRNDNILFGLLRQVSVCQVTTGGLTNCQTADAP